MFLKLFEVYLISAIRFLFILTVSSVLKKASLSFLFLYRNKQFFTNFPRNDVNSRCPFLHQKYLFYMNHDFSYGKCFELDGVQKNVIDGTKGQISLRLFQIWCMRIKLQIKYSFDWNNLACFLPQCLYK